MRYLLAILSLELLLIVHELGHFWVARLLGMKASQFTVGLGPTLFSFGGNTSFLFKCVPVGASVRIRGMNPHEPDLDPSDPASFASRARLWRALVIGSGCALNALLALVVLVGLHVAGTHVPVAMTIGSVAPGSEAARAQLKPGDRIETVDAEQISQWSTLVQTIADHPEKLLTLGVVRRGERRQIEVQPRADEDGNGRLGISQQYVFRQQSIREAVRSTVTYVRHLGAEAFSLWVRLLHGKKSTEVARQILQTVPYGLDSWLRGLAALSLALAVFFIIPLPGLDGGRLLFLLAEAVLRRPLPPRLETLLHVLGFLALLAALLAIPIRELLAELKR